MTNGQAGPLERTALGLVYERANAEVLRESPPEHWDAVAATHFRFNRLDITLPALTEPAFGINYGEEMLLQRTLNGRNVRGHGVPGALSLLPPGADSRWQFHKPGEVALIVLNRQLFGDAVQRIAGRSPGAVEIKPEFAIRDLTLERVAHQLLASIALGGPGGRLEREGLSVELADHMLRAHSNLDLRRPTYRYAMAPSRLKRVEEFVLAHLPRDISLKDIAAVAGMSVFHLAKAFKQSTGKTPYGYVTEHRLHRARSLLHDRKLSIGEVARAVGLSHGRFTTVFRRRMAMSPTEFRAVLHA